jgi:hypothetical protein
VIAAADDDDCVVKASHSPHTPAAAAALVLLLLAAPARLSQAESALAVADHAGPSRTLQVHLAATWQQQQPQQQQPQQQQQQYIAKILFWNVTLHGVCV